MLSSVKVSFEAKLRPGDAGSGQPIIAASSSDVLGISDLGQLHDAATALREALVIWLGDLVPPYADEVLHDLQEITAQPQRDLTMVRDLVCEAASVMEMLPNIPPEWEPVNRAALAAGVVEAT